MQLDQFKRREFITLIGGAAAASPLAARAQQTRKIYRIGLLGGGSVIGPLDQRNKSFLAALAERGFAVGDNVVLEQRWADGNLDLLPALAAELKAAKVDLIVTFGYPAAFAAKFSASETPTVISGAGDPVASGLVEGVARPGGYLTGVTELSTELSAKRPSLSAAIMMAPDTPEPRPIRFAEPSTVG